LQKKKKEKKEEAEIRAEKGQRKRSEAGMTQG
jgi:hypothetical protein